MTAGLEAASAEEYLYATLHGDATLAALVPNGIWNTQADEDTPYPIVVFQLMSALDTSAVGANRIWTDMVYLVKAIGQTADPGALDPIAARIDALLHRASGSASDGTVWAIVREQVIRMPENVAGRFYRHSGGMYRIYAS